MDLDGYLRRLGLDRDALGRPSAPALFALHRAHVERVAYEALDVQMGVVCSIDPADSAARISGPAGRGGYCYVLNGAFSTLLRALGYDVAWHQAGVHGSPEAPVGAAGANHLALTAHGLPTDDNPEGDWFVDAGLGDALYEPLPLRAGTYRQEPHTFVLRPSESDPGGWAFDHDPVFGSFIGMNFRSEPATPADFQAKHEWLSTAPESGFVRTCVVQRRDATGVDELRGLVLRRVDAAGAREIATLEHPAEWFEALESVFGLTLAEVAERTRTELFTKVHAAHVGWRDTRVRPT